MSKEKKLMKDTILYAIANFGSSFLTFLALPIYTFYFTPDEFGVWDVAMTTISLLIPLISFELISATYRWLLQTSKVKEQITIISTGFFQLVRHILITDLFLIVLFFFVNVPYKLPAIIMLHMMLISSFLQQCARGLGKNILFACMGLIQSVIFILLNILFIFIFHMGIELFFYAQSIAGFIVIVIGWLTMNFHHYLQPKMRKRHLLTEYYHYSIPIIPAAASWWVMTMADRWIIVGFLGVGMNGIYAIAIKIPAILLMINTIFSLAWKDSAILSYNSVDKNDYYTSIFQMYYRFMATSVICLILLAKPLIALVIDAAYFNAWKYTGILLIAALFHALSLFWSAGFHGAKETKTLLSTTFVGALLNLIINLLFIHFIGLYAVALSTLIAFIVTWLLRVKTSKKLFHIQLHKIDIGVLTLIMLVAIFIPFLLNRFGLVISIGCSLVLFIVYNKPLFIIGWNELKKKLDFLQSKGHFNKNS